MALKTFLPINIAPRGTHTATCIFLHGLGATAEDWTFLADSAKADQHPWQNHIKWIFPQAPLRAISVNNGAPMPAWFDIIQPKHALRNKDGDEDEAGIRESLEGINQLIDKEVKEYGIAQEKIIVGGFSQGAGLALLKGVTSARKLGGIAVLSGYLPLRWKVAHVRDLGPTIFPHSSTHTYYYLKQMKVEEANSLPVFWAHGTSDSVIDFSIGQEAMETMKASGMRNIEFHSYKDVDHSSCLEERDDLWKWLSKILPTQKGSAQFPL